MRPPRSLSTVLTLAWGLWFGGLITLFIAVTSLFNTFAGDRSLAGSAAAGVFRRFELYQLVLAAAAVIAAFALRAAARGHAPAARRGTIVLVTVVLAAGLAVVSTFVVTARIDAMRLQRQSDTPEFRKLHGISMTLYLAEATLLLATGLALPGANPTQKE